MFSKSFLSSLVSKSLSYRSPFIYPTRRHIGLTWIGAFFSEGFGIASLTTSFYLIFFNMFNSCSFLTFICENSKLWARICGILLPVIFSFIKSVNIFLLSTSTPPTSFSLSLILLRKYPGIMNIITMKKAISTYS